MCRGRRRVSAPLVVIVFVVRWTRWDFRGCTRSTHNGSEGVLRPGWWTWYRASKWTWSTAGESTEIDSNCQGQKRGAVPLAGRKSNCQGQKGGAVPLAEGNNSCRGQRRALVPLPMPEGCLSGVVGNTETHLGPCVRSRRFPLHRRRIRGVMIRWYGSERSGRGRLRGTPLSRGPCRAQVRQRPAVAAGLYG